VSRRAAGFTLLEVLLATALLAAGLAVGYASLRAATAAVARSEASAERNERIRAVSTFLRRRIGGARGMVYQLDPATGASRRFVGDARQMQFVADLPDYLGRGGPYLHLLATDGRSLTVDFRRVQGGRILEPRQPRPPEPLARDLTRVEFAYRTLGMDGQPGPWLPAWTEAHALPLQVRVRIADAQGAGPDLIVALPLAGSFGTRMGG
jgi:general secretion pathway protein J